MELQAFIHVGFLLVGNTDPFDCHSYNPTIEANLIAVKESIQPVVAMESLLIRSANGEDHAEDFEKVQSSVFQGDFQFATLDRETAHCSGG